MYSLIQSCISRLHYQNDADQRSHSRDLTFGFFKRTFPQYQKVLIFIFTLVTMFISDTKNNTLSHKFSVFRSCCMTLFSSWSKRKFVTNFILCQQRPKRFYQKKNSFNLRASLSKRQVSPWLGCLYRSLFLFFKSFFFMVALRLIEDHSCLLPVSLSNFASSF